MNYEQEVLDLRYKTTTMWTLSFLLQALLDVKDIREAAILEHLSAILDMQEEIAKRQAKITAYLEEALGDIPR